MPRITPFAILLICAGCGEEALHGVLEHDPAGQEVSNPEPEWSNPTNDETTAPAPCEEQPRSPDEPESPPPPPDDCEGVSDLVYVIDRNEQALHLFNPVDGSFSFHGALDCGPFTGTPASMSVSRNGYAYVRYGDNSVYAVHLETMHCEETTYTQNFGAFGMGYATTHASTWEDELYVANSNQLAKLNTDTWSLAPLGNLPSQAELTGNGQGELWAILPLETPATLARLDKVDAQILQNIPLPAFPDPYGIDTFAFATWGGDFWLFVRSYGFGNSTNVYRVQESGDFTLIVEDSGLNLVGAGVSTCVSNAHER